MVQSGITVSIYNSRSKTCLLVRICSIGAWCVPWSANNRKECMTSRYHSDAVISVARMLIHTSETIYTWLYICFLRIIANTNNWNYLRLILTKDVWIEALELTSIKVLAPQFIHLLLRAKSTHVDHNRRNRAWPSYKRVQLKPGSQISKYNHSAFLIVVIRYGIIRDDGFYL